MFMFMFNARFNQSRTPTPLTAFVSHTKGLLKQRQQFAVNVAFWCLVKRRCDCNCDPCACGSLVLFGSCVQIDKQLLLGRCCDL